MKLLTKEAFEMRPKHYTFHFRR